MFRNVRIKNRYLLLIDAALCFVAYAMLIFLVKPVQQFGTYYLTYIATIVVTAAAFVFCMLLFGMYRVNWMYANVTEYQRLLLANLTAAFISTLFGSVPGIGKLKTKEALTACLFSMAMICFVRFFFWMVHKATLQTARARRGGKRTLIVGAGQLAALLMHDIYENDKLDYDVIGMIDDDTQKTHQRLYGVEILGTRDDIVRICREQNVEEIIFAIESIEQQDKTELLNLCARTGKRVRVLPGIETSLSEEDPENVRVSRLRELQIEDLLERDPIRLDNQKIEEELSGKTVLVTGGGGSIGSELCRQILRFKPALLIIIDIYENTTYELENELREKYPDQKLEVLIASVRDKKRLDDIFEKYHPEIVFHAAAHKHVPLMEFSPMEAVKNNVFGTYNTALCSQEHGVRRFVMISTDKAVNPTNVMGATKRMCEMIVQTLQKTGDTEFVAVRFGNVLGSNGSVIPRFRKQIAAGGPVTVTHPDIVRYFMTIPEAAQLVLQAASYAKGGEIFVLDMGKPVRIYDLARKMIRLSGFEPDKDIKIEFTGLRPGEKLYEELLMDEEGLQKTAHSKIYIGQPLDIPLEELDEKLAKLKEATVQDEETVKRVIAEVVPTYHSPEYPKDE